MSGSRGSSGSGSTCPCRRALAVRRCLVIRSCDIPHPPVVLVVSTLTVKGHAGAAQCRHGQHPHRHPAGCHPGIPAGRNVQLFVAATATRPRRQGTRPAQAVRLHQRHEPNRLLSGPDLGSRPRIRAPQAAAPGRARLRPNECAAPHAVTRCCALLPYSQSRCSNYVFDL
jgi:hypothetical protein